MVETVDAFPSAAMEKQALSAVQQGVAVPEYEEKQAENSPDTQPEVEQEREGEGEGEGVEEEPSQPVPSRQWRTRLVANQVERPSRWRRLLVIIGMLLIFWFISSIRSAHKAPPKVVHASR